MLQGRPAHDVVKEIAKEGCLAPIQLIFLYEKTLLFVGLAEWIGN